MPTALLAAVTTIRRALILAIALLCSAAAPAADLAPDAAFVQAGIAEHTRTAAGGLIWDWGRFELASLPLMLYGEVSIGRWHAESLPGSASTWFSQFGLTPALRYRFERSAVFVEAGIGLHFIDPLYGSDDKRFSTRWNFGDHLAVGTRFGERGEHELALRLQHFSNGGLRKPNPGEDFLQLRYTRTLD